MSEALKPCPFCGAEAVLHPQIPCHCGAEVECVSCLARVGPIKGLTPDEGEADVTAVWNARVDASERHADGEYIGHLQARVEELEAALRVADAHFTGTFSEGGTDHQTIRAALNPEQQ